MKLFEKLNQKDPKVTELMDKHFSDSSHFMPRVSTDCDRYFIDLGILPVSDLVSGYGRIPANEKTVQVILAYWGNYEWRISSNHPYSWFSRRDSVLIDETTGKLSFKSNIRAMIEENRIHREPGRQYIMPERICGPEDYEIKINALIEKLKEVGIEL